MKQQQFPTDFIAFLASSTLVGVKGGIARETFLNIWMVEVAGRVFARSWAKSNRSWFTAFVEESVGQIQYGQSVLNVKGERVNDTDLNLLIDEAYKAKYTQEHNLPYVAGITQPEYHPYTMEFIFDSLPA
ncbi:DUF2255 family protein [Pontibacter amylolyticus]|uniref:DUF2255 family protein n=1 Tax=Pontibacter amylolyticus TaxID=1424080 RepID=A0ABQ1WFY9_9BACT|nr:DUF2255 family protein [Pontibacter amylolyticus]GGG28133.1 hypothetical protein GCM10011323_34430 [Pontibacter amylolyticus]